MITFDLSNNNNTSIDTHNLNTNYGILIVNDSIPQSFIPISPDKVSQWDTVVDINPENLEEFRLHTSIYSGKIEDLIFKVEFKLL